LGLHEVDFDPREDIEFLITESLPFHPNALTFLVTLKNNDSIAETWYSVGGGFVIKDGESGSLNQAIDLPFPVNTAEDLLHWCRKTGLAIHEVVLENENAWRKEEETRAGMLNIWRVMKECMYRGSHTSG